MESTVREKLIKLLTENPDEDVYVVVGDSYEELKGVHQDLDGDIILCCGEHTE